MSEPKTSIRLTGTRTGKLRASIENYIPGIRFEVTIGGKTWNSVEFRNEVGPELRARIVERAKSYANQLLRDASDAEE